MTFEQRATGQIFETKFNAQERDGLHPLLNTTLEYEAKSIVSPDTKARQQVSRLVAFERCNRKTLVCI